MILDREDREAIRVMGFWYWLWCTAWAYRGFMRLVHRYNWHHCTVLLPSPDGSVQHWCKWCGLRYVTPPIDYARCLVVGETHPLAEQSGVIVNKRLPL